MRESRRTASRLKHIRVVAGILRDAQGRVLLAQRGAGKHLAGLWEFPGGKVEAGEAPLAALRRELHEELGVDVDAAEPLITVPWHYPGLRVDLEVWDVSSWHGAPHGREGQALAWSAVDAMHEFEMPPADRPVVTALALPRTMLVTAPPGDRGQPLLDGLERALAGGIRLVQLRAPGTDESALEPLVARVAELVRASGGELLVNGHMALAARHGAGVHLPASAARSLRARPVPRGRRFGVSVHDAVELAPALALDADYVVAGPVRETASHPGVPGIGWARFAALVAGCPVPVFAIGGLAPGDLAEARAHGAFGVAGIRAFARG